MMDVASMASTSGLVFFFFTLEKKFVYFFINFITLKHHLKAERLGCFLRLYLHIF